MAKTLELCVVGSFLTVHINGTFYICDQICQKVLYVQLQIFRNTDLKYQMLCILRMHIARSSSTQFSIYTTLQLR